MIYRISGLVAGAVLAAPALVAASYVGVTWGDDAVHFFDQNLADTGSFITTVGLPNGVAAHGGTLWVGSFTSPDVVAYDATGTEQFRWALPAPFSVQALTYAGSGQLLAMDAENSALVRFDAFTGAVLGSAPAVSVSTEALAVDGANVWQLVDENIYLTRLADGAVIRTLPNAAHLEVFEGTAMASVGDSLVLGSDSGNWYRVSKLDGSVLETGNNGLSLFDLQTATPVPEPAATGVAFALGTLALAVARTRRRRANLS